jgi:hypothetical protein
MRLCGHSMTDLAARYEFACESRIHQHLFKAIHFIVIKRLRQLRAYNLNGMSAL